MTRHLSELLGAKEPNFRLSLRELERSNGDPSADIRLSTSIMRKVQNKIRALGLDPENTTGEELYATLQQRLLADDQRLRQHIGLAAEASADEFAAKLEQFIKSLDIPRSCFAIRSSAAKRLLKQNPPLKAMKQLGYRSLDSMIKHEPVNQIYAAATLYESPSWHKALLKSYEALTPSDFETRQISLNVPKAKRWEKVSADFAAANHHNSIAFKELGAVILLPVDAKLPALAITSVLMAFKRINDIRVASTFIKLQQVRPDFGQIISKVAASEPYTTAKLGDYPLPWKFLHEFFAYAHELFQPELFEPHVQTEDLELADAEAALAQQIPALEFWLDTKSLALVDGEQSVSLNMLDVALGVVNGLPFVERIVKNARERVWTDLLASYLNPAKLQDITRQLSDELTEPKLELADSAAGQPETEEEVVQT